MSDDVAARYARPPRRRLRVVLAVLGATLAVLAFASVVRGVLDRDVRWREVSFEVAPEEVALTFEVFGDAGSTVRCQVRASDERFADVGQVDVDLGPLPPGGVSRTVTVRTASPAVSASVRTCITLPDGLS